MNAAVSTDPDCSCPSDANTGRKWLGLIFGLIVMNLVIVATTIYFASSDQSSGVEPDYYARALNYNREIDQRAANARLGWRTTARLATTADGTTAQLTVTIVDRDGIAVGDAIVRAEAFASLRSSDRRTVTLSATEAAYSTTLPISARGQWRVRVVARRGGETFTGQFDVMLDGPEVQSTPTSPRSQP